MIAYKYNNDGLFVGTIDVQESPREPGVYLLPAQTTLTAPTQTPGKHQKFNGTTWDAVEPAVPAQTAEQIFSRLTAIDLLAVRPLRAITIGVGTEEDNLKLVELENEAQALRVTLAGLPA